MIEPFLSAVPVLQRLEDAGFEAYFVGGSVRDYLLSQPINDVDIATSATPTEVKSIFMNTVDIGIEHGTVLVLFQHESYEVTTFRTETEYQDYRRPKEVFFIRNLKEDLQRRDFTMNAIAMDRWGKLSDPFNGQAAIEEKVIQTVGVANNRFQEDALRMMRAIRFVSQLSFTIESETIKALAKLVPLLENIAVERKQAEFEKLLIGKNYKKAIQMMIQTDLYSFLPGLRNQKEPLKELMSYKCKGLKKNEMWSLLLFCLGLQGKSVETYLREWRLPVKKIRNIQQILHVLRIRIDKEWTFYDLYLAKRDIIGSVEKLYQVIKRINQNEKIDFWLNAFETLPIKDRTEMKATGSDLMVWLGQNGGPWLNTELIRIEQAIIEGKVNNDKQKIKEWLLECNQK